MRLILCTIFLLSSLLYGADHHSEIHQLLRQQRLLKGEVPQISRIYLLEKDAQLKVLKKEMQELSNNLNKTRKEHPQLKTLYLKNKVYRSSLARAIQADDKEKITTIQANIRKVNFRIINTAKILPELVVIENSLKKKNKEISDREKALLKVNDAQKIKVDLYIELGETIAFLRGDEENPEQEKDEPTPNEKPADKPAMK